jgi:Hydroxyphenylpyruvate dioxygenase, HPPD, N-terminal
MLEHPAFLSRSGRTGCPTSVSPTEDRGFESFSLRRRVHYEPASLDQGGATRATRSGRVIEAETSMVVTMGWCGPSVSAMALRVDDASAKIERAVKLLDQPFRQAVGPGELDIPAVRGFSGSATASSP